MLIRGISPFGWDEKKLSTHLVTVVPSVNQFTNLLSPLKKEDIHYFYNLRHSKLTLTNRLISVCHIGYLLDCNHSYKSIFR